MFNNEIIPPNHVWRRRTRNMKFDIQLPTLTPGVYGHTGRQPNTDSHVKMFNYRQQMLDAETLLLAAEAKRLNKEIVTAKYEKHVERRRFNQDIEERFKDKIKAYEQQIDERRQRLKKLLCEEEQEFISETIYMAQKGVCNKMDEMKKKAELLKARREEERLAIVKEKRMQQYITDSQELRPVFIKQNLMACTETQLQQIKEHENKKETEKELDNFWHKVTLKEIEAKKARETQELLKSQQNRRDTLKVWQEQITGKEILKHETQRIAEEDRLEFTKLQEQLQKEKMESAEGKKKKTERIAKELLEQIEVQRKFQTERQYEEDAITEAFNKIAAEEIAREKSTVQDTTEYAKRELAIYRNHLKQLEAEKQKEDAELDRMLMEHQQIIQKKQEDVYCKAKWAREELQKKVLAERAAQIEHKKSEAEKRLQMKKDEAKLMNQLCEMNNQLEIETNRLQAESVRVYKEELQRQIEANRERRKLEKEEADLYTLKLRAKEDERTKMANNVIKAGLKPNTVLHPFKKCLDKCALFDVNKC